MLLKSINGIGKIRTMYMTFQFKGNYSNNYTNFATKFNNCKITFDDSHFLSIAHLSTTYAIVLNDCTSIQCPRKNDCMGCNYIPKNVAHQANTGTKFSVIKKTSDSNKKGNMEFAVFSFDSLYKPQMSV